MHDKFTALDATLYRYLLAHSRRADDIEADLIEETEALGPSARMQTAPDQAQLLAALIRLAGARRAVEVGTFTGLSALAMARALPEDGRLLCCDSNAEWTAIAEKYWTRAGVRSKIDLEIGPAIDTLRALPKHDTIDLSYIDADKRGYLDYYEALLQRTRRGGAVLLDNVLWGGSVVDETDDDASTLAIRRTNDHIAQDDRVHAVMLAVGDGLTIAVKK